MKSIISFLLVLFFINCNNDKKTFSLCSRSINPYYNPTLEYKGDFYEIKEYIYKNYSRVQNKNNTGIVRIQFHVNCFGETGNYKVNTYSLDYESITIDKDIINQLFQLTKELKKWIPAVDDNGENIDSHKFFAFKLVDGKLIDILPK